MSQQSSSFPTARPRIVVAYHHDDTHSQAQRLIQALKLRFGDEAVKAFNDLPESWFFPTDSPVFLVVLVGKKWAGLTQGRGPAPDAAWAVETLTSALSSLLGIIPVLVNGAPMPEGTNISHLSSRSLPLRDARWELDVEKLAGSLTPGVENEAGERAVGDSVVLRLRREDAIKLLSAMLYLGFAPGGSPEKKKGPEKKDGKAGKKSYPKAGKPFLRGGKPSGGGATPYRSAPAPADVVSTTVFSPRKVSPGTTFLIQVTAHLPEDAAEVEHEARQIITDAEKLGSKKLDYRVERETKLSFALSLPSMEVDDPSQHLTWWGTSETVQFGVTVPENHRLGNVIGTVRVSQDGVPFGHVKFQITVAAAEAAAPAPPPQDEPQFVRYERAFVSYASPDRHEVLKRAQMLARLVPFVFMDFINLEPGERWEKGLYKHIDECDVFLSFLVYAG